MFKDAIRRRERDDNIHPIAGLSLLESLPTSYASTIRHIIAVKERIVRH